MNNQINKYKNKREKWKNYKRKKMQKTPQKKSTIKYKKNWVTS